MVHFSFIFIAIFSIATIGYQYFKNNNKKKDIYQKKKQKYSKKFVPLDTKNITTKKNKILIVENGIILKDNVEKNENTNIDIANNKNKNTNISEQKNKKLYENDFTFKSSAKKIEDLNNDIFKKKINKILENKYLESKKINEDWIHI
jgi:hypothetical protein